MSGTLQAENRPAAAPVALPELRSLCFIDRASALGLAVDYLMTKPPFALVPFGHWSRMLAGQINRGHYLFVCRGRAVVGFAGWALATADEAEAWLAGRSNAAAETGRSGTCVILSALAANGPDVQDFLLNEMRRLARQQGGIEAIYAKPEHADGLSRPLRLGLKRRNRARTGIDTAALSVESSHPTRQAY